MEATSSEEDSATSAPSVKQESNSNPASPLEASSPGSINGRGE
nr:unnamed protein product [Callosobruchus chinensis]CAI5864385.1 unnamed protein product [Callosobruchus analis]